jgi:hypothetical protein
MTLHGRRQAIHRRGRERRRSRVKYLGFNLPGEVRRTNQGRADLVRRSRHWRAAPVHGATLVAVSRTWRDTLVFAVA